MSKHQTASFAGGVVGGVAGYFAGGNVALGFQVGAAIGGALVPEQLPDQVGGQLTDLEVTSSAFGQPIPLLWGTNRVSGRLIFSSGKKETQIETEQGAKGGPEQTAISYTYAMDAAYSLGQLPPSASTLNVRKIWINSKLVYDISETSNAVSMEKSTQLAAAVTVYDGAEDQLPSSLQESYLGAGNVPAYRGQGLLEFEDLQLGPFSNGTITVSVEVVVDPVAGSVPYTINAWAGNTGLGGLTGGTDSCVAYDNGVITTAHDENRLPDDSWEHVVRRHDMEGNILSEQRKRIYSGPYGSGTPTPRFGYNDPMMVASHGGIPMRFRLSKFDGVSPNGIDANMRHPFNATYDDAAWGVWSRRYKWCKWGDYYYVAGGSNSGGPKTVPAHLSRYPIITDINSAQFGYARLDADIAINIGATYGYQNHVLSLDIKNQRLYMTAVTSGTHQITSWDTELNLITRWQEPTVTIPSPIESGQCFFSGNKVLGKDVVLSTHRFWLYEFDPDVDNSTFNYVNHITPAGAGIGSNVAPLTENLVLTPLWLLSIEPRQAQKDVSVSTIIGDMLALVGASPSDYDVSSISDTVDGYRAGDLVSARRGIEPIMTAYFIDAAEVDNKIVFTKRGGASAASIPDDDLLRVNNSLVTQNRGSELELPKRVTFSYINQASDYQINEQHADRLVTVGAVGISNVSIPVVITNDEAAQITDALLYSTWIEREKVTAYVSVKHIALVPGDVITLGSSALRVRIQEVDTKLIGAIKLQGVIDYAPSYISTRSGGDAIASSTMAGLEGPTILHLLDIPILRDLDDGIIKYYGSSGVLDGWGGSVLYKSTDSGKSYAQRDQATVNTPFGYTTDTLSDGDTSTWDSVNTVNIGMASGTLSSADELDVLNGANVAAIGEDGRWEIVQWQTATLEGDGTYTLSDLLRGRRGTEHNTANHEKSDALVLLTETTLRRLNDVAADIDQPYLYKAVTIGSTLQETSALVFTNTAISITPFSPTYIQGTRDGSNNLTTTFKRRDRLGYRANYEIPMSESTQSYEIEYWDTGDTSQYGTFKTATTQTHSYTAAQQTTDGATPGQSFLVKIYQISATVGRGYEGSEVI